MKENKPIVSVIICTYNRCKSLEKTLKSLLLQQFVDEFNYEIIIINNNSKDATKEVIESFIPLFHDKLRYFFEEKQGVAYSRNTGIEKSLGELIVFTDDDCTFSTNWLNEIVDTFKNFPADAVLGKITLVLPEKVPAIYSEEFLQQRLAAVNYGDEIIEIPNNDMVGANMSFRKKILKNSAGFKNEYNCCEDTEFSRRLTKSGMKKYYSPKAEVFHWIPRERLNNKYFFKQAYIWGMRSMALEKNESSLLKNFFWVFKRILGSLMAVFAKNKKNNFLAMMSLYTNWGRLNFLTASILKKMREK